MGGKVSTYKVRHFARLHPVHVAPFGHHLAAGPDCFRNGLTFKESPNLTAALLRASGTSRSAKFVPLSPIGISDFLFDKMESGGCVNVPVGDEVQQLKAPTIPWNFLHCDSGLLFDRPA